MPAGADTRGAGDGPFGSFGSGGGDVGEGRRRIEHASNVPDGRTRDRAPAAGAWTPEHGGMLARLAALPEVMRHIGTRRALDRRGGGGALGARARALARVRLRLARGVRARGRARRRHGRARAGRAGVPGLDDGEHEIGWWIDPAVWGRGYATEGGRAIVDEAFGRVGAPSVAARIQPGNAASRARRRGARAASRARHDGRHGEPVRILRLRNAGRSRAAASIPPRCGSSFPTAAARTSTTAPAAPTSPPRSGPGSRAPRSPSRSTARCATSRGRSPTATASRSSPTARRSRSS